MDLAAKAISVNRDGEPDGFDSPLCYQGEVLEGGHTRLVISVPPGHLERVHRGLVEQLQGPFKVLYQQLTDRRVGQLPKPISRVGVEISRERLLAALEHYRKLIYHDGRHQFWIRGVDGSQLVLEEIGMLYLYPDDPSFRDALDALSVPAMEAETMAVRDYVQVNFMAECDAEEVGIWQSLSMVEWAG